MDEIETDRLYLRHFTPDDIEPLCQIRSDPDVMRYMRDGKPLSREQVQANLNDIIQHYREHRFGFWAIIYKEQSQLIGCCGLRFLENTPEIELGYMLAKPYWGRGLATEGAKASLKYGFEELKLERIVALAYPQNIASRRVMEKLGMKYEKDVLDNNRNLAYYAISREAYSRNWKIYPSPPG